MSWLLTLAAASLVLLGYWQHWRWRHRRMLELAAKVPGPIAWPIVGNSLLFLNPAEQLNKITKLTQQYGDYLRIWLGPDLNIFVKNPADIRLLLTSNKVNQKGPAYDLMKRYIGPGILTGDEHKRALWPNPVARWSDELPKTAGKNWMQRTADRVQWRTLGATWRNHRKIATPSYNKNCVQEYTAVFNRKAEVLAKLLCRKDPSETIDVYKDVVKTTTQCVCGCGRSSRYFGAVTCTMFTGRKTLNMVHVTAPKYRELLPQPYHETLMGLSKEDSQNLNRLDELVYLTQIMYSHIYNKMTKWWLQIPLIYWIVGAKKTEDYYLRLLDDLATDIVNRRRKDMECHEVTNKDTLGIVDRYILSGDLTEQEIKWETFSLFTTSQEASAKIASGVLMILAHLPDWQEKVYEEILEVLGVHDVPVTTDKLKDLHQLDMVYKETLRYFSVAAVIQRTVEEEITINDGKITLPAGTSLVIPIHDLHRDPRYWPEPYRVMPERFLPENVAKRDPNAFVPFSLGAMDCLGRVYATALIKTLVVRVLRKVHLEGSGTLDNLPLEVAISVKPVNGFKLRVKPRRVSNERIHA